MKKFLYYTVILSFVVHASGQSIFNTGYSTSTTAGGVVDDLWQITSVINLPPGYSLSETPPYAAFVSGNNGAYDQSTGPSGLPSSWISFNNPNFNQVDDIGIITTYTLNFSAPAGSYQFNFEADNGVSIYLGAINPGDLVYTDGVNGADGDSGSDFTQWHSTTLNIASPGNNQLNVEVFNAPGPTGSNPTAFRADFIVNAVPEPSTLALLLGLGPAFVVVAQRRRGLVK